MENFFCGDRYTVPSTRNPVLLYHRISSSCQTEVSLIASKVEPCIVEDLNRPSRTSRSATTCRRGKHKRRTRGSEGIVRRDTMTGPVDQQDSQRLYISLAVDDPDSLDALAGVAKDVKLRLWPNISAADERRKYRKFDRSKVHITLWACDLPVSATPLNERLRVFLNNNWMRLSSIRIRFEKLSYLAKTETRYIVACLDSRCRPQVELLKRRLEKSFRDLGKSLLDRDTCQLHCSIVAYTTLNVRVNLLDALRDFRSNIASVGEIRPSRILITSKWDVLACGTFRNGEVTLETCVPRSLSYSMLSSSSSSSSNSSSSSSSSRSNSLSGDRDSPQLWLMDDAFEEDGDIASRTIDLINFPYTAQEKPTNLLLAVAHLVGCNLEHWMILSCKRELLQNLTERRTPDIVAVFVDQDICDDFLANVKKYWKAQRYCVFATAINSRLPNNKISVVKQLPMEKKLLLGKAKRFRIEHDFKYCWLDEDEIFLREDDTGPKYIIRSLSQLQQMIEERLEGRQYCYNRSIK